MIKYIMAFLLITSPAYAPNMKGCSMRYIFPLLALVLFSFSTLSTTASAELYPEKWTVICAADANELRDQLTNEYGEVRTMSTTANDVAFEMWYNKETQTWTIMFVRPSGSACVVVAGTGEWLTHPGI